MAEIRYGKQINLLWSNFYNLYISFLHQAFASMLVVRWDKWLNEYEIIFINQNGADIPVSGCFQRESIFATYGMSFLRMPDLTRTQSRAWIMSPSACCIAG